MTVTYEVNRSTVELNMGDGYTSERWYKPQTIREKVYLIVAVITTVLFLIFIITTVMLSINKDLMEPSPSIDSNVCLTSECIISAAKLLNSMDDKVDPCEHFYTYACGNWAKNYQIVENIIKNEFDVLSEKINKQLKEILEKIEVNDFGKVAKYAANFYHSCVEINTLNDTYILKNIHDIIEFPIANKWIPKRPDSSYIPEIIARTLTFLDAGMLFQFDVSFDVKNTSANIITVFPPTYTLSDKFSNIGYEKLYHIIQDARENDSTIERLTIGKFNNLTKYNHWLDIIHLTMKYNWVQFNITEDEYIQVYNIKYFINLFEKIKEENISESTIVKYVAHFSKEYFLVYFRDVRSLPNIEHSCLNYLHKHIPLIVDHIYFSFVNTSITNTEEMIRYLKMAFKQLAANANWLDDQTRQYIYDKVESMVSFTGYNPMVVNITAMEKYYEHLEEITDDNLILNSIKIFKFNMAKKLSLLRQYNNRNSWRTVEGTPGIAVNAAYYFWHNSMSFPAAVQQFPFYDLKRPWYLNFGTIGFIIGHEITHGIDNSGSQYDKYGNLYDWWNPDTKKKFQEKTKCFVDQYNKYKLPEINQTVNGIKTLGENIADNEGLRQAYLAYQNWEKKYGKDKLLPGLGLDSSQLFFLSFANMWCSSYFPEEMKYKIKSDVHTMEKYRIIGTLSNMQEFSDSFNCKKNSGMNPENKCAIW